MNLYHLLENPLVYKLVVSIFSLGGRGQKISGFIDNLLARECQGKVVELGSGTCQFRDLYLKYLEHYVATDLNLQYLQDSQKANKRVSYVACDASRLPFLSQSVDRAFALYLFHHLSDEQTRNSLREMWRCLQPGGKIIIVDNFLPEHWWDLISRAVAWLDRGQYVRRRQAMENLIKQAGPALHLEACHQVPGSWPYVMSAYVVSGGLPSSAPK